MAGKWVELLKQVAPDLTRAAVLRDFKAAAGLGQFGAISAAAQSLGVELVPIGVGDLPEIERGVTAFARSSNGGLIVTTGGNGDFTGNRSSRLRSVTDYPRSTRSGIKPSMAASSAMDRIRTSRSVAPPAMSTAFSRAKNPPTFRCRHRPRYELAINSQDRQGTRPRRLDAPRPRRRGDRVSAGSSCGSVRIDKRDLWLVPRKRTSDLADEVTLSRKLPKGRTHGRKFRSTRAKAGTPAARRPNALIELETQLETRTSELAEAREHLAGALEQQAATSEVLRIISRSPEDLRHVFETILANATRLCQAEFGNLDLRAGDGFRIAALHNAPRAYIEWRGRQPVVDVGRFPNVPLARIVRTKAVQHIP